MNWDDYRRAIDAEPLRADFQERTIRRLERAQRKERFSMRKSRILLTAACVAALLAGTVAAAVHFLSARDVAAFNGDETLAAAFSSDDAVILDESVECGEYTFRLAGIVSGRGLSDFASDVEADRSYLVVSRARTDGTPIEEPTITDYTVTPLVAGYKPWLVNIWTLGGGASAFSRDGVVYYVYEFDSIEMFADRTVYLAIYEGFAPSANIFEQAEDGTISYNPAFTAPHAIFELPLDPAGADPAAVEAFLTENGLEEAKAA